MPLLTEPQKNRISDALSPAIHKSGDLRLPARFTKLSQKYIEDEFALAKPFENFNEAKTFEMMGEAMRPTILGGAMLVVDANLQPKHNDIVVAEHFGETICRRIFISKRKTWLYSDDKDYKFIDLSKDNDVKVLGVVTSHYIEHNAA